MAYCDEEDEEEDLYDDSDICDICGAGPYDEGCPSCKSCGGIYSPGTEECDFCRYSDECGEDLLNGR